MNSMWCIIWFFDACILSSNFRHAPIESLLYSILFITWTFYRILAISKRKYPSFSTSFILKLNYKFNLNIILRSNSYSKKHPLFFTFFISKLHYKFNFNIMSRSNNPKKHPLFSTFFISKLHYKFNFNIMSRSNNSKKRPPFPTYPVYPWNSFLLADFLMLTWSSNPRTLVRQAVYPIC